MVALDPVRLVRVVAAPPGKGKGQRATGGTAVSGAWSSTAPPGAAAGRTRARTCSVRPRRPGRPSRRRDGRRRPSRPSRACGRERDDHRLRVDDGRDARGHLPGLGALGVDDGHLLELEGGLHRGGVRHAAADDEEVLGARECGRELVGEGPAAAIAASAWSAASAIARRIRPPRSASSRPSSELRGDQRGGEGLGHDRHVARAARGADDVRGQGGPACSPDVDDRDGRDAALPRLGDRDDVTELARCRDADDGVAGPSAGG